MKKKSLNEGFTLMEMLIVIAIIAILVAVAIPTFANSLDNAKEATCAANRRSLLAAVKSEQMLEPETDIKEIFEAEYNNGEGKYTCPSGGVFSYKLDDNGIVSAIACTKHGTSSLGDKETFDKVMEILLSEVSGSIDSNAPLLETNKIYAVMKKFEENGINLEAMGVKTWQIKNENNQYFFTWTGIDISGLKDGDSVPVMRYNETSGNYTVWCYTVTTNDTKDTPYKVLSSSGSKITTESKEAEKTNGQTYDNALEIYNKYYNEYLK